MNSKISSCFALFMLLLTSLSFAQTKSHQIKCSHQEYLVLLSVQEDVVTNVRVSGWLDYEVSQPAPITTFEDQSVHFEFLVNNSGDTNTYFGIYLLQGKVVKKELLQNGNDSDNYVGSVIAEGDLAFSCVSE